MERSPSPRLPSLRSALILALSVALTGCWEIHQRVTVNPDGSARIRLVREIPLDVVRQMQLGGQGDMEEAARSQAAEMIRSARGVEAWADVEWGVEEDVIRVAGTAFVPDLGAFAMSDPSGDDDQAFSRLGFRRTDSRSVIELSLAGEEEADEPLPTLTREEAAEMARTAKSESRQMRSMAAGMFIDMREVVELRLPSEPTEVEGFTRGADGAYRAAFEGEDLLAAIGAIVDMSTDSLAAHLRAAASAGRSRDEAMSKLMLDRMSGVPARLVLPPAGERQFDYTAEVAAAAESYPELKERLGIGREADAEDPAEVGVTARAGAGREAAAVGRAAGERAGAAAVEGPPEAVRLEVGRAGASSSLDVGTTLVLALPSLAGADHLGLATGAPEGLSVTDDAGRELVAASREAFRSWQEANPGHMTSRELASWRLGSTRGEPSIPTLEIELWATPSPGARWLRVRGDVPIRTLPEGTRTATVRPGQVSEGAVLTLGDQEVTLSHYATMTRGEERSAIYEVEGPAVVTAVRRGGETLWQLSGGDGRIAVPEELSGGEPLEFVYGSPGILRVPLDLRFGIGLESMENGGR